MRLCWNAILKNEVAVVERCVNSLLPHIDAAIVVDTGSTDGTPDLLKRLFDLAGKPIEIISAPFTNFEQARNEALRCARISRLEWDFLLLADADMEFKVHRKDWFNGIKRGSNGVAYDIRQTAGALGYWNRRLVSRTADCWYIGVTHEFINVPSSGALDGAEFIDHADGANRADKYQRDIALLETALKTETRRGLIERYTFYLAGTYYDLGKFDKAAEHYYARMGLGGFEEEAWYARMRYGLCLKHLGHDLDFVNVMLKAYEQRPSRIEPLYELARYYREKGRHYSSMLFSETGMQVPYSKDLLFVNEWMHKTGLREEFAICAYYDERRRRRGAREANKLALSGSEQARYNMFWYLRPLKDHVPSFKAEKIPFQPPEGYVATNPSVLNYDGKPLFLVRTVNYTITPEGHYAIRGETGTCAPDNPIHTRNFLVGVPGVLDIYEIALPKKWPEPRYKLVRGFEDSRLFVCDAAVWTISTVRELTPEGWCEQVVTPIEGETWRVILPKERRHEKNWMPWLKDGKLCFVYRLGTLVDIDGRIVYASKPDFDVSNISGGSQVVSIGDVNIALVHEARSIPGRINRYYQHRFVTFESNGAVDRISAPFFFHDRQIEFCAGLAYFPGKNQLMVSYGVRDCEAWTATIDADEVVRFIYKETP